MPLVRVGDQHHRLGHAVALEDLDPGLVGQAAVEVGGQRCGAGYTQSQASQAAHPFMSCETVVHGRYAEEEGCSVDLDGVQHGVRIESWLKDGRGGSQKSPVQADAQTVHVE